MINPVSNFLHQLGNFIFRLQIILNLSELIIQKIEIVVVEYHYEKQRDASYYSTKSVKSVINIFRQSTCLYKMLNLHAAVQFLGIKTLNSCTINRAVVGVT